MRLLTVLVAAALGILAVACNHGVPTPSGSFSSSAITNTIDIGVKTGAPDGVTARCRITVLDDGRLNSKCRFTNPTNEPKRFVFCMMIDLKSELRANVAGTSGDLVTVTRDGNTIKCTKTDATGEYSSTSYHFGCKLVELGPGESKIVEFDGASVYKAPPGLTVKAQDFLITYADTIVLSPTLGFDPTDCRLLLGEEQAGFVLPVQALLDEGIGAWWVVQNVPFLDPFIAYQASGQDPGPKEYSLYEDAPCLPSQFPASVDQLEVCPNRDDDPPPVSVDLNLFYIDSHDSDEDTLALIEIETRGDTSGLRIETDPPEGERFEIPGGEETFGTLRVCAEEVLDHCEAPDVREGRQLELIVNFVDPESRELLFPEFITFIADTEPPIVEEVNFEGTVLTVIASDETTSPIHASVWFSEDDGETWEAMSMEPNPLVITEDDESALVSAREFRVNLPQAEVGLRYFILVQDVLFNLTYFGIEEL